MTTPATEIAALAAGLLGVLAALVGRTHLLCREGRCACSLNESIQKVGSDETIAEETTHPSASGSPPEEESTPEEPPARARAARHR